MPALARSTEPAPSAATAIAARTRSALPSMDTVSSTPSSRSTASVSLAGTASVSFGDSRNAFQSTRPMVRLGTTYPKAATPCSCASRRATPKRPASETWMERMAAESATRSCHTPSDSKICLEPLPSAVVRSSKLGCCGE